ncbi:helix-turn-helix transcriptional regulator [Paenibacillaceae bacterium WGS1546]|uniref:helix-turn-helix transcriptional regulator n=1 Tax=Cohnella sp. WGS1546 TaxID=3366810 RepID=UPI00372D5824
MDCSYEELARDFARIPLEVYGVYRTELKANLVYSGHVSRPTTRCGVVIALRGHADFVFDGSGRYGLEPGGVLLGGLGRKLEIYTGEEGFEYGLVHYLPVLADREDARRLIEVLMLQTAIDPELLHVLDRLLEAAASPDSMGLLEKKALFYRLVNHILLSERIRQNKESYSLIDEAIQYIREHHARPLTLDMLAERYQIKAKYFSSQFRKYAGIGPIDYLIRYRMNRANEMLVTGQFPVSVVAKSVGYSDAYYFSRLFKKHKGVPPSKVGMYRKRNHPS